MNSKIGQEVTATEDFEIKGYNKSLQIKKGDKGFVDNNSWVHYINGNARGKMVQFKDLNVKGYDVENISKLIFNQLDVKFNIKKECSK